MNIKNISVGFGKKKILWSIIVITVILSPFIYSSTTKFLIRKTFEKAFFYRAVGNCDTFVKYVSIDKDDWLKRCIEEKTNDGTVPIKDYKVLRVDFDDSHAFLQAQLTRNDKPYVVNYELIRNGLTWKIYQEIKNN